MRVSFKNPIENAPGNVLKNTLKTGLKIALKNQCKKYTEKMALRKHNISLYVWNGFEKLKNDKQAPCGKEKKFVKKKTSKW